ncbi:MAG TPA: metallopeptidase family protein, partial [Beutenbergiaceae bacterium]|nr:metallopeptidase family protein [Beutenbergiaceae bacterium]
MFRYPRLPTRSHARRRDRRGRGMRGPLMPGALPASRTRTEQFDAHVSYSVSLLETFYGNKIAGVEFGVEDVPPSNPAPWEVGAIPLGRYFPADAGLPHRIVVYRRPIIARAPSPPQQFHLITSILVEQI